MMYVGVLVLGKVKIAHFEFFTCVYLFLWPLDVLSSYHWLNSVHDFPLLIQMIAYYIEALN